MRECEEVSKLAKELGVDRTLLYQWKQQLEGRPAARRANLSQTESSEAEKILEAENRRLKEALGQKALEVDFLAAALRRTAEQRQSNTGSGGAGSTPKSGRGANRRKAN
jgi:transposase-like protein